MYKLNVIVSVYCVLNKLLCKSHIMLNDHDGLISGPTNNYRALHWHYFCWYHIMNLHSQKKVLWESRPVDISQWMVTCFCRTLIQINKISPYDNYTYNEKYMVDITILCVLSAPLMCMHLRMYLYNAFHRQALSSLLFYM